MKYINSLDNEDEFKQTIINSLFEKVSEYIENQTQLIKDDMNIGTIFEEDVDDYLEYLKSEGIEYTIEDDLIIEKTSKIVKRNKTGSGLKRNKMTRVIKPCAKGETRVGKRGCRKGTTGKAKKKARRANRTKKRQVSKTSDGKSKKRNRAIGKFKAKRTRKFNK